MNSKRRKTMYDPEDCAKYITGQIPGSMQELKVLDRSTTDNKISFKITNNKNISDFWGLRR